MTKKIDALSGFASLVEVLRDQALGREIPGREDVFRDDELPDGRIVDTCRAYDTQEWETGVLRPNDTVIVEQYPDREAAEKGHAVWVERLKTDPSLQLSDVMVWDL